MIIVLDGISSQTSAFIAFLNEIEPLVPEGIRFVVIANENIRVEQCSLQSRDSARLSEQRLRGACVCIE